MEHSNSLLVPDDLHHLKRGGRLTPLAATLGGLLKIKPILQINEHTKGKIDVAGKVRTMSKAMDTVIERMKQAGVDRRYSVTVAHADAPEAAEVYRRKIEAAIEGVQVNVIKLVSVVGVHTGAAVFLPVKRRISKKGRPRVWDLPFFQRFSIMLRLPM